jgi:hypothetical protein
MAAWNSHVVLRKHLHEALADEKCTGGENSQNTGLKNEYDMILLDMGCMLDVLTQMAFHKNCKIDRFLLWRCITLLTCNNVFQSMKLCTSLKCCIL